MFDATDESWRTELAMRENGGVTVRLFWSRATNLVTVAVSDSRNGDFELILDDVESALDAFYHPFAHAAARGLELGMQRLGREVLLDAA